MSITTDAREAAEAFIAQGKAAVGDARKPFYAWVGASDLALKRISTLQAEAQARARTLQAEAQTRARTLQEAAGGLPDRAQQLSPAGVRAVAEAYGEQARDAYDYFARRGAQVVAQVRRSPAARRTEARFEQVVDEVDETVADTADSAKATTRKATASARRTGRTATARKSAPNRSKTTKSTRTSTDS